MTRGLHTLILAVLALASASAGVGFLAAAVEVWRVFEMSASTRSGLAAGVALTVCLAPSVAAAAAGSVGFETRLGARRVVVLDAIGMFALAVGTSARWVVVVVAVLSNELVAVEVLARGAHARVGWTRAGMTAALATVLLVVARASGLEADAGAGLVEGRLRNASRVRSLRRSMLAWAARSTCRLSVCKLKGRGCVSPSLLGRCVEIDVRGAERNEDSKLRAGVLST